MKTKTWMRKNYKDYVEYGELNTTQMAEDCAVDLFNRNANEDEFFAAFEVSEELGL